MLGGVFWASLALAQPAPRYGLPPQWGTPALAPSEPARLMVLGRAVAGGTIGEPGGWACHSCHGMGGEGGGSGAFPRITGLSGWYLYKQLQDYASGQREHAVMSPIARSLDRPAMEAVAAWYAAQEGAPAPRTRVDARVLQTGGALNAAGAADRGVQACVNCHGAERRGMGPSLPALAGQYAAYTALQLRLYRANTRGNSPLDIMHQVAAPLTDADIAALAAYFETVRPAR